MKRLWGVVLGSLALVFLASSAAAADAYDPSSESDLEDNGWTEDTYSEGFLLGAEEITLWCKTLTDATEADRATFPIDEEPVQETIEDLTHRLSSGESDYPYDDIVEEDTDYIHLCVNPEEQEAEGDFFCVVPHLDLPPISQGEHRVDNAQYCWDAEGGYNQSFFGELGDALTDPMGMVVDSTLGEFVDSLNQGVRWFLAMLLYWWILVPHADLEETTAAVMWPPMLGFGLFIGILLLVWQGVKMMFSSKAPGIMVQTLKGLAYFALWTIAGISVISTLSHASESLTAGIMQYSLEASEGGCTQYQAEENPSQPDGLDLDFPDPDTSGMDEDEEERANTYREIGMAFGSCAASQMYVQVAFLGFQILFYIIAFLMSLVQGLLLFIREAAFPVMALLLPIAAAGQIGGSTTRRWLPNLLVMMLTLLAYKPMVAVVFAVGFTSSTLSDNVMDILRGLLTLMVGVVAPAVLLKAFKPLATQGVEELASMGSAANNVFLSTQIGGSLNQWAQKRAGERAAQAAQKHAATQAAHQGGGMAITATKKGAQAGAQAAGASATAATGPFGWAARAGQALKGMGKSLIGQSQGIRAEEGVRSGHTGHPSGQGSTPADRQPGLQVRESGSPAHGQPGLQVRESGSPAPAPEQPGHRAVPPNQPGNEPPPPGLPAEANQEKQPTMPPSPPPQAPSGESGPPAGAPSVPDRPLPPPAQLPPTTPPHPAHDHEQEET